MRFMFARIVISNMAAISKQEYLKRYYLSNSEGGKKKKKKKISKTASKHPTSIILDDDITLEDVKVEDGAKELTEFDVDDDEAPAVYEDDGVTKISLETYKKREEDKRTKWAPINQNTQSSPVRDAGQKSNYDSDKYSPPRIANRRRQDTPDLSPQRGRFRDSPDQSPPRKRQGRSPPPRQGGLRDSPDQSPPRKRQGRSPPPRQGGLRDSPDQSPPRKRQDRSPPRRSVKELSATQSKRREADNSPPRSRRRHDSGDSLPEQVHNRLHSADRSTARRVRNDSPGLSPPRSGMNEYSDQSPPRKRTNSDSDQSPPRKGNNSDSDQSPPRKQNRSERGNSKSNSVREKGPGSEDRMPSGRKAGLLSASDLKKENERKKARDAEMFSKMDATVSGKGSETVYRDKMGRKKDIKMDRLKRREEERKEMEENEQFMEWGRGVTQTKETQEKVADYLHEIDKPLARYRDDKDLDKMLKDKERDDDPMLAYMKQQKTKQDVKAGKKEKPVYKGRDPPPNRFNIRPGYRWDGVDRSNGFEKKRFAMLANKKATQSQAYKWSSEDL